jgi:hypothetical protein
MSTIIGNLNTQRNANCVVQASQLNGGNLAQFFNLQAMRIIKGTVILPTSSTRQGDGNVLINEYDGSAIELGGADVIVAAVVENGSGSNQGSVGYVPLSATGPVTPGVIFTYGALPTFNPGQNSWMAGATGASISDVLTLPQLNTGIRFTPIVSTTSATMKYWINCVAYDNTAFTSLNPVLNVTLLVLNPSLAM